MNNESKTSPFTLTGDYAVEEISLQEFLTAVSHMREKEPDTHQWRSIQQQMALYSS